MPTSLDVLNELHEFNLKIREDVGIPLTIQSIALNSGTSYKITFSGILDSSIYAGCLVYIDSNVNAGYYIIQSLGSNFVNVDNGTALTPTGAIGAGTFYKCRTSFIDNKITNQWIPYTEKITRTSFSGIQTYNEVYDGSGGPELFLMRRNIVSVVSVQLLNLPNTLWSIPASSIEIVPNRGVIRVRAINLEAYTMIAPIFPKGQSNVKIQYTAGFASMPADINQAIILMTAADVLGFEAGISGAPTSLSVINYSRSDGVRGRYTGRRNDMILQARNILRRYSTGVV